MPDPFFVNAPHLVGTNDKAIVPKRFSFHFKAGLDGVINNFERSQSLLLLICIITSNHSQTCKRQPEQPYLFPTSKFVQLRRLAIL